LSGLGDALGEALGVAEAATPARPDASKGEVRTLASGEGLAARESGRGVSACEWAQLMREHAAIRAGKNFNIGGHDFWMARARG
jgi:hypothetical protein